MGFHWKRLRRLFMLSCSKEDVVTVQIKQIACIGAGHWGKNLIRNFNELGALGWICESNHATREEFKENYPDVEVVDSFDRILASEEVKGVAIATPAATHGAIVRACLEAGKDVFVEKPICLDIQEARQLVELARERGRILMVGHLLWYHPVVLKLKELIDAGELGKINYIYSNRLNLGKIRREENILWSFAPHDISVILGLLEESPESVQAQAGSYLSEGIADVTMSLLSFKSGVKAHIFVSWLHPFKEQKLVVVGDRKMAVFNDLEPDSKLMLFPHSVEWHNRVPVANKADAEAIEYEWCEPLRAECLHFIERMADRKTPRTDGEEALRVLRVLDECQRKIDPPPAVSVEEKSYFAHESAFVDEGAEIGKGTTIWHVSHIMKGTRIGEDCRIGQNVVIGPNVTVGNRVKIQNNVSVYEAVTLEDDVFCGPSMVFTNVINPRSEIVRKNEYASTRVGKGASLGANCTVVCGHDVGKYAFIGAGAVVTKDVPDYALVVGNPARISGWMCECGYKIAFEGDTGSCSECDKKYKKEKDEVKKVV